MGVVSFVLVKIQILLYFAIIDEAMKLIDT